MEMRGVLGIEHRHSVDARKRDVEAAFAWSEHERRRLRAVGAAIVEPQFRSSGNLRFGAAEHDGRDAVHIAHRDERIRFRAHRRDGRRLRATDIAQAVGRAIERQIRRDRGSERSVGCGGHER